jgi:UDP-glucose 4-epimerase
MINGITNRDGKLCVTKTGAVMNKMNGKILVTGGAGYIGSHVVKLLCDEKYQVVIIDNFSLGRRENVDVRALLIEGDVLNETDLEKVFTQDIRMVFHFAAWKAAGESMIVPEKYAKNNISGTIGLLNKMMEYGVKYFIFSSSAAVYGNPRYLPIDEKHPLNPANYYGYTKLAIEQNCAWYSQLKGLRYAALRYFNATGYDINGRIRGKEKNPANLSPIVMEVAAGLRKDMEVFGNDYDTPDGTCIRDYIHVNDLANAHLLAMKYVMDQDKDLVVNLGAGKGHSVMEVIKTAERVTGKKIAYTITARRAGDPQGLVASSDLAAEELNWKTRYSDLETIFKTMAGVYLT